MPLDEIDPRALRASTGGSASYSTTSLVFDWMPPLARRVASCCALLFAYGYFAAKGSIPRCSIIVKAVSGQLTGTACWQLEHDKVRLSPGSESECECECECQHADQHSARNAA